MITNEAFFSKGMWTNFFMIVYSYEKVTFIECQNKFKCMNRYLLLVNVWSIPLTQSSHGLVVSCQWHDEDILDVIHVFPARKCLLWMLLWFLYGPYHLMSLYLLYFSVSYGHYTWHICKKNEILSWLLIVNVMIKNETFKNNQISGQNIWDFI